MTVMRRYPNESHLSGFYSPQYLRRASSMRRRPQVPDDAYVLAGQLRCAKWLKRSHAPCLTSGQRTARHPQPARLRQFAGESGQGVTGSKHAAYAASQALLGFHVVVEIRRVAGVAVP